MITSSSLAKLREKKSSDFNFNIDVKKNSINETINVRLIDDTPTFESTPPEQSILFNSLCVLF